MFYSTIKLIYENVFDNWQIYNYLITEQTFLIIFYKLFQLVFFKKESPILIHPIIKNTPPKGVINQI